LVQHVEKALLADPGYVMSYADAARLLNRKPAKGGRHVGQVVSCIGSNANEVDSYACDKGLLQRTRFFLIHSRERTRDVQRRPNMERG